jgi:polyphosphate glucokinase
MLPEDSFESARRPRRPAAALRTYLGWISGRDPRRASTHSAAIRRPSSRDFPFAAALSKRLGQPVRLLNDAEVQGFGIVTGKGLEVVLTLGTGAGTAVFRDGVLMPHLEFAQHPIHDDQTYNDYIGSKALQRKGVKKWSRRVRKTIKILASLLHYDKLYLGGGDGSKVIRPPGDVQIASNQTGITGGIRLWDADVEGPFLHENGDVRQRPKVKRLE